LLTWNQARQTGLPARPSAACTVIPCATRAGILWNQPGTKAAMMGQPGEGLRAAPAVLLEPVGGNRNQKRRLVGGQLPQLPDDLQATHPWHRNVQQHDIRSLRLRPL